MRADFPAAHSMDTLWFAVDRDGHVGCFGSGEAGAVPEDALAGDAGYQARRHLVQLPRGQAAFDLQGRITPGRLEEGGQHRGQVGLNYPVLIFLTSADPLQEEIAAGQALQVPATEGVAFILREVPAETIQRLHASGACRGCFWYFAGDPAEENEHDPDLASRGLYDYQHLTENWISGPYGRQRVPLRPLHIDQLPPALRNEIKQFRFDNLSFAETPYIQPVEHTECASWEAAWIDSTGKKVRPMPGREDSYADAYAELSDMGDRLDIEPPTEGEAEGE